MARKKAEAQEPEEGSWASLKKTIIAALTTLIAGGGTWLGVQLFNGGDDSAEEAKTEQAAPAGTGAAPITINVQQNQENKQKTENNNSGGPTIIREKVIEKAPAQEAAPKPKKEEEDSW